MESNPTGKKEKLATTTLPQADEMLKRLMAVDKWPILIRSYYPAIVEAAGAELNSHGIVMLLLNATAEVDEVADSRVSAPLYGMIPRYIDAIVDDAGVATEAKNYWDGLQKDFKKQKGA